MCVSRTHLRWVPQDRPAAPQPCCRHDEDSGRPGFAADGAPLALAAPRAHESSGLGLRPARCAPARAAMFARCRAMLRTRGASSPAREERGAGAMRQQRGRKWNCGARETDKKRGGPFREVWIRHTGHVTRPRRSSLSARPREPGGPLAQENRVRTRWEGPVQRTGPRIGLGAPCRGALCAQLHCQCGSRRPERQGPLQKPFNAAAMRASRVSRRRAPRRWVLRRRALRARRRRSTRGRARAR